MKNAYMTPAGGEEPESVKVTCSARRANPGRFDRQSAQSDFKGCKYDEIQPIKPSTSEATQQI